MPGVYLRPLPLPLGSCKLLSLNNALSHETGNHKSENENEDDILHELVAFPHCDARGEDRDAHAYP